MKRIGLMDTSVFTDNLGDYIIMESTEKQLSQITKDNFVVKIPTHSPAYRGYQTFKKNIFRDYLADFDYKFVCGTNLLWHDMKDYRPQWDINKWNSKYLNDCILVGVGDGKYENGTNSYTKKLYQQVLSNNYIHSTRDEKTKVFLESMGLRAINTGCCTTWDLDKEHCKKIKITKSDSVIFTLTDYCRDIDRDQKLINTLNENYKKIFFWVQGFYDYEYLMSLDNIEDIVIVGPSLESYNEFLENTDCDYIGTRLHAGIKAMQKFKRSIILIIDNRARNMHADYNFNCIEREDIDTLEQMINNDIITDVHINRERIDQWLDQFIRRGE